MCMCFVAVARRMRGPIPGIHSCWIVDSYERAMNGIGGDWIGSSRSECSQLADSRYSVLINQIGVSVIILTSTDKSTMVSALSFLPFDGHSSEWRSSNRFNQN